MRLTLALKMSTADGKNCVATGSYAVIPCLLKFRDSIVVRKYHLISRINQCTACHRKLIMKNLTWKVGILFIVILLGAWIKVNVIIQVTREFDKDIVSHFNTTIEGPGVILHLKGGIGNQLFEFACSYSLARDRNWPLYNFIVRNSNETNIFYQPARQFQRYQREFALDNFQVPLDHFIDKTTVLANLSNVVSYLNDADLLYKTFNNESTLLQLTGNSYCQSPEYWRKYKNEIVSMFQLKPQIIKEFPEFIQEFRELIDSTPDAVAVHVRRGDFTRIAGFDVPISYQRNAIRRLTKILQERGATPTFFIFSDDMDYVRRKLQDMSISHKFIYVSTHNSDGIVRSTTSIQDFFLMTKCKHFIIPNSTFSWWAAYLSTMGSGKNRIVIASTFNPKFWDLFTTNKKMQWFYKILHGRMYHPKKWIVINPFIGET